MIEFIKRNKFFSGCIILCLIIIVTLIGVIIFEDISGKDHILDIPPLIEEEKDPQISLFSGEFEDADDVIELTWDYQLNKHTFQKVELYRNEELIKTLYNERSYQISIYDYDICTGDNEFELRLYYDNGIVVSSIANVFVDYVFNMSFDYQMIDNNIGQGYLLTLKYDYNVQTPAGLPQTEISTDQETSFYWKWEQISIKRASLENGYQRITIYYLLSLDSIPDEDISWMLDFKLDSVGIRYENSFTENPKNASVETTDMEL